MDADEARARFSSARVARLATVSPTGPPHLVPIVFVLVDDTIYHAVDSKPKSSVELRRLANVAANPEVCVLADEYDEDWTRLWWARADGFGRVLHHGDREAGEAIDALVSRYEQYREHRPDGPVLAVNVQRWSGWTGD